MIVSITSNEIASNIHSVTNCRNYSIIEYYVTTEVKTQSFHLWLKD